MTCISLLFRASFRKEYSLLPCFHPVKTEYMFQWMSLLIFKSVAQAVKRLPAIWETWVRSLGREDPLEKEMATHSSTLSWKIPWMEEPGGLQSMGSLKVRHDWSDLAAAAAVLQETVILFSKAAVPLCILNSKEWELLLLPILHSIWWCWCSGFWSF